FFLGQTGSGTLTVNFFKDANANGTNDAGEGVNDATVFLFSPATGGQEAVTATVGGKAGVASFASLTAGDYQVGVRPNAALAVAFNSSPQPVTVAGTGTTVKNFALSNATTINITGLVTWAGAGGVKADVFASSQNGFSKITLTLTGGGAADAYTLPVQPNNTYSVGVGPAIPDSFMTPGAPPPPPPDFVFMPPANLQVQVAAATVTGKNFTLTSTGTNKIVGTVKDSGTTGISSAMVFCRPTQSSTSGAASGFGAGAQTSTAGAFTVKVTPGVYLCGTSKPGMPPVSDKQATVADDGTQTPTSLDFVLAAGSTGLTISGTLKDDSGNAIPYGGVSSRKVNSTTDTNPIGGDSSNFVGGPTDANGAYTLYVSAGTWVVEAFAPGVGRLGTKTISVSSSNVTGQDFSAQTMALGSITGTATKGGAAQQGVMVRAENALSGNMAVTGTDGTYTLKVPAGSYTLYCYFPGVGDGTPLTNVAVAANTETPNKNCTLAAPITITVKVTNGQSAITNAGVDVRDANGRGNFTNVSTTSGIYAVYTISVPPGTYSVRVGNQAYGTIGETSGIASTQIIIYAASAGVAYAVTGTVTGDAVALSGAWVSLIGTPTGQTTTVFLGDKTAADGTFSISVPAGVYRVRADKPGYRSPAESSVTVAAATISAGTIAITTASRTISGTVTLSGAAVSNAFVDASDGLGGFAVSQTDASGAYSLAVDNGTWTLRAHASGYEGGPIPVTVSSNSPSGQVIALSAIAGFTIKPEKPETVTPTSGGFLTNTDIGTNFKLNIPANALGTSSNASTVTTKINTAMPNPPSGAILSKNAVTISVTDSSGQKISSLNNTITLVVPYDEANLPAGASEGSLVLGSWNDATQSYDTLATTVDTVNNTLTATVSHLSDFAPLVASADAAPSTPTNLSATNLNTGATIRLSWTAVSGAATYNIYKSTDNSTYPLLVSTSSNSYTATSLLAGTIYYFKVSAVSSLGGESAASSAVQITPVYASSGGGGTPSGGGSSSSSNTTTPATTPTSSTTGSVTIMPATGGDTLLTPTDAATPTVKVAVPANAVTQNTTFTAATTTLNAAGITVMPAQSGATSVIGTYELTAVSGTASVSTFQQPVTLTFTYQDSQLPAGAKESELTVMYYSTATGKWESLVTTVDAASNKVTATTNHFTIFVLALKPATAVITLPPSTAPATSVYAGTHPNGTLILDGTTVYLLKGGKRVGFRNPEEYFSYGYNFGQLVSASAQDKALSADPAVAKALEGTLVLDKSDNRTVYMIGPNGTKRGFTTAQVYKQLGYTFKNLAKIDLSDYTAGPAISSGTASHPEGALVVDAKGTVWWVLNNTRQGFQSVAVFNTYGFSFSKVVKANSADLALPAGELVKFRDGTLVKEGAAIFLVSDGKKMLFTSMKAMTDRGYKATNAISASASSYETGSSLE
ncbi:hypothetical protein D4S03_08725, partial [bacterium]